MTREHQQPRPSKARSTSLRAGFGRGTLGLILRDSHRSLGQPPDIGDMYHLIEFSVVLIVVVLTGLFTEKPDWLK